MLKGVGMKEVIFVDDELNVLQGLRRMLRPLRKEWKMTFAESGLKALEIMETTPFDVIVSDMRMPGMDGAELLTKVMKKYPQTVRIVLSGHSEKEMIMRLIGPAHQYLAKPCSPGIIEDTVAKACALRDLLANESLEKLVTGLESLPSIPAIYAELIEELRSPEVSSKKVGSIISKDVGMTAKILQLVNSAFFGLNRRNIFNIDEAVNFLGLDTIQALVLVTGVFSGFHCSRLKKFSLTKLWHHSMAVGVSAKHISMLEKQNQKAVDDTFMAGLLHDVGKLVLATNLPEKYEEALELLHSDDMTLCEAESSVFGATHAEVGAYLVGLWGIQNPIVEVLAFHHSPGKYMGTSFAPVIAVHFADSVAHEFDLDDKADMDIEYLKKAGFEERLPVWHESCVKTSEASEK